jgi:transcriptional regulator with XRE-family HTH domain
MISMDDNETKDRIAANLHRLRGELSYSEIARRVGTYPMAIQRIERGDSMPGVGLLTRIADALGCGLNDFVAKTAESAKSSTTSRKTSRSA